MCQILEKAIQCVKARGKVIQCVKSWKKLYNVSNPGEGLYNVSNPGKMLYNMSKPRWKRYTVCVNLLKGYIHFKYWDIIFYFIKEAHVKMHTSDSTLNIFFCLSVLYEIM